MLAVALPSVLLSCLWGYTMASQLQDTLQLRAQTQFARRLGAPLHTLLNRMQDERRLTAVWQAGGQPADRDALTAERTQTDGAVQAFRTATRSLSGADPVSRAEIKLLGTELAQLTAQRAAIDGDRITPAQSLDWYKAFIQQGMVQVNDLAGIGDAPYGRAAASAYIVVQVTERLAREDAEVAAALATGRMSASVHTNFAAVASARRDLITSGNVSDLPTAAAFRKVVTSPAWTQLGTIETAIIGGNSPGITSSATGNVKLPPVAAGWTQAQKQVRDGLISVLDQGWSQTLNAADSRVNTQLLKIGSGTAFFLATALFTVLWTRRLARRIVRRLADLRQSARDLADNRLPELMERVNSGEPVDVRAELTPQDYGDDELGRTATEVTATQLAAVASAVQRARSSEGTRKVFVNLARRTQVLVHRQIAGLDDLERGTEDPELLARLFEVDHIATRIRRNAENLAILGGAVTARQWRSGVALLNVVRAAVSEVEDYARVKVPPAPRALLAGPAVTDVIHLLAELIENGTHFSPPHTQVSVTTQTVPSGCVIEVEDRGLGMEPEEYERVNHLLANPPDPGTVLTGDDPRLGLYVVARLAHRHGVQVSLRKSPYGGSCAIVLLPPSLIETAAEEQPDREPLLPAGGSATARAGRAALDSAAPGAFAARLQRARGRHAAPPRPAELPFTEPDPTPATATTPATAATSRSDRADRAWRFVQAEIARTPPETVTRERPEHERRQSPLTIRRRPERPEECPEQRPEQPQAAQRPAETDQVNGSNGTTGGSAPGQRVLPKRVRQASLARQMRESGDLAGHAYGPADDELDGPPPERSRNTMAAIQRGTRRGRAEAEPRWDDSNAGSGTKEPR